MEIFIPQLMDRLIWSLTSAPSALSCPCPTTSVLWPSYANDTARSCATTRRASTIGPTSSAPCPCPLAPTAGWWTSARARVLKSAFAMHLWSAKGPGARPGWATTVSHGCYRTMRATTPSYTRRRKCPCRLWRSPRGSVCFWTGPRRRCCSTRLTPVRCCTRSTIPLAPRCCQRVQWVTAVSPYCTDGHSKGKVKSLPEEDFPDMTGMLLFWIVFF